MSENMNFPIPNAVLEPYIKTAVSAAIASALGDGVKVVELAVQSALGQKVNRQGRVSTSSYENTYPLVETVAANAVQEVAREVIQEMAEKLRPKIKAQIEKEILKKHSAMAQVLVDGTIDSLKSSWSVQIQMKEHERY